MTQETRKVPSVTIAMIVKNEAESIGETIASARVAFGDALERFVIHDTGSTDGTVNAVKVSLDDGAVELVLGSRPFDRFDNARNAVLDDAERVRIESMPGEHFIVMLSAGCRVVGSWTGRSAFVLDCEWRLGKISYRNPIGYSANLGLRYHGALHELLVNPGFQVSDAGITLDYCLRDTARQARWARDLELLERDQSPRGRFYYAQTLDCLGRRDDAYRAYIERGSMTDGSWQERVMAWIRAIPLAPTDLYARRCVAVAVELDPSRGEAWLELAEREHRKDDPHTRSLRSYAMNAVFAVPKEGSLFIDTDRERRARWLLDWCDGRNDPR